MSPANLVADIWLKLLNERVLGTGELENLAAEIQLKHSNERVLRTGEPCICEYVTLLLSYFAP